jgi:hypothetical protein
MTDAELDELAKRCTAALERYADGIAALALNVGELAVSNAKLVAILCLAEKSDGTDNSDPAKNKGSANVPRTLDDPPLAQ